MNCANNCDAVGRNQIDSETFLCDDCLNDYIVLNKKNVLVS
jgi:hypothetical protein